MEVADLAGRTWSGRSGRREVVADLAVGTWRGQILPAGRGAAVWRWVWGVGG